MAKKVLCPNCGVWHELPEDVKKGTFENRVRRPFRTEAMTPALPQPGFTTREAPAGMPNRETHVTVPFDQAIITGFFAAPVGGVVAYITIMVIDATPTIEITSWGKVAFVACGVIVTGFSVAGWMWLKRLGVYDGLLWTIEEFTGADLDGDEEIGEPEPEVLKVELHDGNGIPRLMAEFNTDRERFVELARLTLVLKKGFSEETASEAGYSRKEWIAIRDKFFSFQAAAWKNRNHPKQGIDLGSRGINILKAMLPPTLPAGNATPKSPPGTNGGQRTDDLTGRYDHIQGAK